MDKKCSWSALKNMPYPEILYAECRMPEFLSEEQKQELLDLAFERLEQREMGERMVQCVTERYKNLLKFNEIAGIFGISEQRARQVAVCAIRIMRAVIRMRTRNMTQPNTYFDLIKNMTLDEMAESKLPIFGCPYKIEMPSEIFCRIHSCSDCIKNWLESEVKAW